MSAGITRKKPPLRMVRFMRGGITTVPCASSSTPRSTAATRRGIGASCSTSFASRRMVIAASRSLRIAADPVLAVGQRRGIKFRRDQSGAQRFHLRLVQAHRRMPQRTAIEALQPGLVLPCHPMDEMSALGGGKELLVGHAGGMVIPVKLHRLLFLAVADHVEQ